MADSAWHGQISRRSWLLAGLATPLFRLGAAESLAVSFDGDNLHVSAPSLHFLSGKPLARLKDGLTVVYVSKLTVFSDAYVTPFRVTADRFIISYDVLADEKFFVTMPGSRSASNLSAAATEAWCFDNLAMNSMGLAPERLFWLQVDIRTVSQRDAAEVLAGPGISFSKIIDFFSRKPGADDPSWKLQAGPLRLHDLVRTSGRGNRNG
jgi:hypothetical protein